MAGLRASLWLEGHRVRDLFGLRRLEISGPHGDEYRASFRPKHG